MVEARLTSLKMFFRNCLSTSSIDPHFWLFWQKVVVDSRSNFLTSLVLLTSCNLRLIIHRRVRRWRHALACLLGLKKLSSYFLFVEWGNLCEKDTLFSCFYFILLYLVLVVTSKPVSVYWHNFNNACHTVLKSGWLDLNLKSLDLD